MFGALDTARPSPWLVAVRATAVLAGVLQVGACSGGDGATGGTTAPADRPVSELVAVLADPVAATDCELTPSGYPEQVCAAQATGAAEALGDKGDPAAVPALAVAVGDAETPHDVVDAAWVALEQIGGPEVVAVLVDALVAVRRVPNTDPGATDPLWGHKLSVAERAADLLGRLGGVEHNQLLAEAGGASAGSGYATALITINRADATPLLVYLDSPYTDWVYQPLIALGQPDTEPALVAALTERGTSDMAEAFLNSANPTLEQAAQQWAAAHGYTITRLPVGGSVTWGSA